MKSFFKRLKSQKGMSGVLVAMLLVVVGVGLVAGVSTFMNDAKDTLISDANSSLDIARGN
jgi:Flp pilus assembly pilin Flp